MIPVDLFQNKKYVIKFTNDDMRSKFEVFTNNKMYVIYLTEIMITEWIQTLHEFCDEGDKPYPGYFYFWTQ